MEKNHNDLIDGTFPRQKLSYTEKAKNDFEWAKKCINGAISKYGIQTNSGRRSDRFKKQRNYNLINGKFDQSDMSVELQPLGLHGYTFPAVPQYRDIVSPIFNLLYGDEVKRGTSFIVRSINDSAISEKEEKQKQAILAKLQELLTLDKSEEDAGEAIKKVQKYFTYEYQDIKEKTSTELLNYLRQYLKLDQEFSKAWEDALVAGEEIYEIDIISGEPVARRANPLELGFSISNNSDKIDDAEIIVHDTYMPSGQVIDEYWEVLTDDEICELENESNNMVHMGESFSLFPSKSYIGTEEYAPDSVGYMDEMGNIRVTKCRWKSKKKIGRLTYFDENDVQQETYVDEAYKGDKTNKEEVIEWFWISEYWEGTKLKNSIYKNIGPRKLQFRKMDNISYCSSGYVGTVYNCNNSQSVSLMDRLVPWIYLHVTTMYRTELLMAANQGKIAIMDLSLIPDGWEVDKWMYYASIMKFAFADSYGEGKKGERTGKLNQSTQNKVLDMELGNSIQHYISILDYIEKKIYAVSGVSPQRLGEISASEGVGNTQRSVTQSAIITEKMFQVHNWTKQRVLTQLIETAKVAYSEDKKKLQYITDDLGTMFFTFDGSEFTNEQQGVFVSDSIKDQKTLDVVKELAHAALQNDKTEFSSVIDIITSNSTAEIKNKLKEAEMRAVQREQQAIASEQEMTKIQLDTERRKVDLDNWNKQQDRNAKIQVAEIQALGMEKGEGNEIIEQTKLALSERQQAFTEMQSQNQDRIDSTKNQLKDKELNLKAQLKREELESKERQHKEKLKKDSAKEKQKSKLKKK